ncbi:hypothetical protein HGK63_04490 [Mycobacteroides abscessus]|nr:hypothetical protein [Mycobacteroides abscessus subsp. abscessus]NOR99398.1 hypothetical protein [Mycobacteroides abscessus]
MAPLLHDEYPNFIGSAALARSAVEHSSRSMYVSAPSISHHARVLRTLALVKGSLKQYKSTNDANATELIDKWDRWKTRIDRSTAEFRGVPKQSLGNPTTLIEKAFPVDGARSYEELSRPVHGNAVWMISTVIQEQKETAVARIMLMRNAMFAIRCVMSATESAADLWGLDLDLVVNTVARQDGSGILSRWQEKTWGDLVAATGDLSEIVSSFDEAQFVDATTDVQPTR